MSQVLALKFSNTPPDQLLGVLTMEEVIEVIKHRVRGDVDADLREEYECRIGELESELEDESGWHSTAESWECDAVGLFRAIEKAISVPWAEAIPILKAAMEEHGGDIEPTP